MTMLFPMLNRSMQSFTLPAKDLRELTAGPPIDVAVLTEQCLGNLSFALTLLEEFEKTGLQRVDAIEAQTKRNNLVLVAELTHSLKGVVGILGADALWKITSTLQSAAQDENLVHTFALIPQLRLEMKRVLDYIPSIRAIARPQPETLSQ